jgi:hypothetical protein
VCHQELHVATEDRRWPFHPGSHRMVPLFSQLFLIAWNCCQLSRTRSVWWRAAVAVTAVDRSAPYLSAASRWLTCRVSTSYFCAAESRLRGVPRFTLWSDTIACLHYGQALLIMPEV